MLCFRPRVFHGRVQMRNRVMGDADMSGNDAPFQALAGRVPLPGLVEFLPQDSCHFRKSDLAACFFEVASSCLHGNEFFDRLQCDRSWPLRRVPVSRSRAFASLDRSMATMYTKRIYGEKGAPLRRETSKQGVILPRFSGFPVQSIAQRAGHLTTSCHGLVGTGACRGSVSSRQVGQS